MKQKSNFHKGAIGLASLIIIVSIITLRISLNQIEIFHGIEPYIQDKEPISEFLALG